MLTRLRGAFEALRPRAIARVHKSVEDLRTQVRQQRSSTKLFEQQTAAAQRDLQRALSEIRDQLAALASHQRDHSAATSQSIAALTRELKTVAMREAQVRAVVETDLERRPALPSLENLLADHEAIGAHVRTAVRGATLHSQPCPYMVVDEVLPPDVFRALITGLPPLPLFADRPDNHQRLKPPFKFAPGYCRRIWGFMADVVVPDHIRPAVLERFREPLAAYVAKSFPFEDAYRVSTEEMTTSDGRILLRRRGYRIRPHRDPKWGFITCLLYLPREGDDERWGTQLYCVENDEEAVGAKPFWVADTRVTPAADVPFKRNRMLVFLNSVGAHGAHIPDDAEPADLERYAYQFRIGPNAATIGRLMSGLPEERRALWAGKASIEY